MIDVVILNYNDANTVIEHIRNVQSFKNIRKILIVDNMSSDNSFDILKKYTNDKVLLISSFKNGGYGYGNNIGIKYLIDHYNSKYILLANPDVIYTDKTLTSLKSFLVDNKEYAIAAPFMLNSKGVKQHNTAFRIPQKWEYIFSLGLLIQKFISPFYYKNIKKDDSKVKDVGAVSGSMFLMDANKMLNFGMYDENVFLYCEEIILGIKLKNANLKIALLPHESFIHNHSVSINKTIKSETKKRSILVKSKLYVIKNYYSVNIIEYIIAWLLGKLSIIECYMISLIRR